MPGKIYKGRNYAPYPPANQTGLTVLCVALFLLETGLFGLYGYTHLYRPISAIPKPSLSKPSSTFSLLGPLPTSAPNPLFANHRPHLARFTYVSDYAP